MKLISVLFFLSTISLQITAQVTQDWVKLYNSPGNLSDFSNGVAVDDAGNIYVTGFSGTDPSYDYNLIKYNPDGDVIWVRSYDHNNLDSRSYAIILDNDGNIYITGESKSTSQDRDIATIKYDSSGAQLWVQRFNASTTDIPNKLGVDSNNNIYVGGQSGGNGIIIKYNSTGAEQWTQPIVGSIRDMTIDNNGNIYIAGAEIVNNIVAAKAWKYDTNGSLQWSKNPLGTLVGSWAGGVKVDNDGNVFLVMDQAGNYVTAKYNSNGIEQWAQTFQNLSGSLVFGYNIALDENGNCFLSGTDYTNTSNNEDDITTIKYSPSGEQLWARTHNGPDNKDELFRTIHTDDEGNVYVFGNTFSVSTFDDLVMVKYSSDGNTLWTQTYSTPNSEYSSNFKIDNNYNVYATGSTFNQTTRFDLIIIKYSQDLPLKITNPVSGIKWIAGEKDTIRWTGGKAGQFVQIDYSADNGVTYNLIDIAVPADSGYFIWDLPENILTTKAKIKITDLVDSTITTTSDSFRIKGYVLTRLDENNQYVAFSPAAHGWQYTNGTLWPQSWWNQFQYATGIDPNTNELYPSFFHPYSASNFIDWPLWVEVFGVDQCYYWTSAPLLGPNYKGNAQEKWRARASSHNGSCFGFAASSFLAFNFRDQFFQKHQGIPNVSNVFSLNLTNTIQKTINGYFAYQFGRQSLDNDVIGKAKDPRTTLLEVMNMFEEEVVDIRTLTIYNNGGGGGGAHTMAPISVTRDLSGPSRYRVNLYDSNNPGNNAPYILVDSLNNTWTDFTGLGATWTGSNHFYLEIPVSNYLNNPIMGKQLLKPNGIANIDFYNTEKANIMFTNSSGQKTGVTNGVVTNELQDGIAIFNKNGKPSDPIGYYVPDDNYSAVLSNITDTSGRAFISAFKQDVIYNYEREDVNVSQSDKFRIDEGFSVISQDSEDKQINLTVIAKLDSSERILFVKETQLRQNDSIYLREMNQSEFIIKNYGTSKTYELEINERSAQEQEIFKNLSVSLQENSSQTIQPNWTDLDGSILNIFVDIGNDGTIDDTLSLVNQVTGIGDDQGSLLTPNSYNLAQNYPNPFNPVTTIQYSIPQRSNVTLKVYDVLGNEIAELVNEEKGIGVYSVNFDASNLASGIYLYKIQAGYFVMTKKMILIK